MTSYQGFLCLHFLPVPDQLCSSISRARFSSPSHFLAVDIHQATALCPSLYAVSCPCRCPDRPAGLPNDHPPAPAPSGRCLGTLFQDSLSLLPSEASPHHLVLRFYAISLEVGPWLNNISYAPHLRRTSAPPRPDTFGAGVRTRPHPPYHPPSPRRSHAAKQNNHVVEIDKECVFIAINSLLNQNLARGWSSRVETLHADHPQQSSKRRTWAPSARFLDPRQRPP